MKTYSMQWAGKVAHKLFDMNKAVCEAGRDEARRKAILTEVPPLSNMEVMIGNQAIALGLVEAEIELAAAYPGTPSSEILPAMIDFKKRMKRNIHVEWSVNERVAMEVAIGAAMAGKKAVCMMKQVGLNVAFPPSSREGRWPSRRCSSIISCDDPGPQSSQTEQDSRLIGTLFNVPVFDASSPRDARLLAAHALSYSVECRSPVILRSTHRVSHAREAVVSRCPRTGRRDLDEGLKLSNGGRLGIVSSGMSYNVALDVLAELGLEKGMSLYKVAQIFPYPPRSPRFAGAMEHLLVLEETDEVLEALVSGKGRVFGRSTGQVPRQGELTYDVMRAIVQAAADAGGPFGRVFLPDTTIEDEVRGFSFRPRPPKLCAGLPAPGFLLRHEAGLPEGSFPRGHRLLHAGHLPGRGRHLRGHGGQRRSRRGILRRLPPGRLGIARAHPGVSRRFHLLPRGPSPSLRLCEERGRRFIVVIMDNDTTAMTGMQPTPQSGIRAEGASDYAPADRSR